MAIERRVERKRRSVISDQRSGSKKYGYQFSVVSSK